MNLAKHLVFGNLLFETIFYLLPMMTSAVAVCPYNWTSHYVNSSSQICVHVNTDQLTWWQAQLNCLISGGLLQTLSPNLGMGLLNEIVTEQFSKLGSTPAWTGLFQGGTKLFWDDIVPYGVVHQQVSGGNEWQWAPDQPDRDIGQCGAVTVYPVFITRKRRIVSSPIPSVSYTNMSLASCQTRLPSVCVRSPLSVKVTNNTLCGPGWLFVSDLNTCVQFNSNVKLSYWEAVTDCGYRNGQLLAPLGYYDISVLHTAVQELTGALPSGSGANINSAHTVWINLPSENTTFTWNKPFQHPPASPTKQAPPTRIPPTQSSRTTRTTARSQAPPNKVFSSQAPPPTPPSNGQSHGDAGNIDPGDDPSANIYGHRDDFNSTGGGPVSTAGGAGGIDQCAVLRLDESSITDALSWQPCTSSNGYICERLPGAQNPDLPRFTDLSSTIVAVSRTINWTHSSSWAALTLTCHVTDYDPDLPVLWVKDGVYLSTVKNPPEGLTLTIIQDLIFELNGEQNYIVPVLQGVYRCEVWSKTRPALRFPSAPTLLTFADVFTYRGTLHLPTRPYSATYESTLLQWGQEFSTTNDVIMLMELLQVTVAEIDYVPDILIQSTHSAADSSTVLVFTVYYTLPRHTQQQFIGLCQTLGVPLAVDFVNIMALLDRLEPEFLATVIDRAKSAVTQTGWAQKYQRLQIRDEDLHLYSTVACPAEFTILHPSNVTVFFPRTYPDTTATSDQTCLQGHRDGSPLATRRCTGGFSTGVYWLEPEWLPDCLVSRTQSSSTDALQQLYQLSTNQEAAYNVSLETRASIVGNEANLTSKDIVYVSIILDNLVAAQSTPQVADLIVDIVNSIMAANSSQLSESQTMNNASARSLLALEHLAWHLALNQSEQYKVVQKSMSMSTISVTNENAGNDISFTVDGSSVLSTKFETPGDEGVVLDKTDMGIWIPGEVLQYVSNYTDRRAGQDIELQLGLNLVDMVGNRLAFFTFDNDKLFTNAYTDRRVIVSSVITASVNGMAVNNLDTAVQIQLKLAKTYPVELALQKNLRCVFWDFAALNGHGQWSTEGCHLENRSHDQPDNVIVTCSCNHLTSFALLMDYEGDELSKENLTALGIISTIGLILSIIGLAATLATFIIFKKLRQSRSQRVLFHLALALLAVDVIFLAGVGQTQELAGCVLVAVLLHFFLLAAFAWMTVEAVVLYLKFVKVLGTFIDRFMLKAALPAWGIPAVIVILVLAIDWRQYQGPNNYCWLAPRALQFAFLLPVGLTLLVNTVLFILIIRGMVCGTSQSLRSTQSPSERLRLQIQAAIACFVVLGLTWLFGFLAVSRAQVVFQYLFCIFNSVQGLLIFIFHVIREKLVRDSWISFICRNGPSLKRCPVQKCPSDNSELSCHQQVSSSPSMSTEDERHGGVYSYHSDIVFTYFTYENVISNKD